MPDQWVVLLEAAGEADCGPIDPDDLNRLLEALEPGCYGVALGSPDRYALQVTATGADPVAALLDVVARQRDAVRQLGLPAWKLVRTEVFTPEDLKRELEAAQREEGDASPAEGLADPEEHDDISRELLHRAFSDPLTGLLGYEAFTHRLDAALGGLAPVAVVSLDLDAFQAVNEHFGETSGDEILITVTRRLAAMLRVTDLLVRLGGDQYGVLLQDSSEDSALAVAERMLDAVRLPMTIAGQELVLSASAGVALSHPGHGALAVLDNAGAALGAAKASGGGRPVLYRSNVSQPAQRNHDVLPPALHDRLAHLQLMQQAAVAANGANTLEQAAQIVMRHICSQVGCSVGHLWLSPVGSDEAPGPPLWHMADRLGALQVAAETFLACSGVGLAERVLATGRPVWIADLAQSDGVVGHQQFAAAGLQSAFAFPVVVGQEVVAALSFFFRSRMEPSDSFLDVLIGIGTQLGRVVERERAADALQRSTQQLRTAEARVREAQVRAGLGSWHFDLRTGDGSWSDGMNALYGLDPRQPLDLGAALESVHPDDRARAEAALVRLVETGEPIGEEIRIIRSDGQMRWHHAEGSATRDSDGVVVAIQGTNQDITDAKVAQDALREREHQLALAQRAAGLGWWEHELSTGRVTMSDDMCRLWGFEPGTKTSFEEYFATVHPDDRPRLLEATDRFGDTEEPVCVEFRASAADGFQRWFRGGVQTVRDGDGKPIKHFGTAQDVTEQKQAEHRLQRATELYQRIIETAHEGIMTIDSQQAVTFVNTRMAKILGYSMEEMTGLPTSAFADEATYALLAGRQRRRRQGMIEHYQTKFRAKDGSVVQVLVSASPFMIQNGQDAGALAMVTDVTAMREAEDLVRSQSLRIRAEVNQDNLGDKPPDL